MEVDIHGAPVYFEIPILGGIPITASMVGTWCVMLVLTLLCVWLTHDLKVRNISKLSLIHIWPWYGEPICWGFLPGRKRWGVRRIRNVKNNGERTIQTAVRRTGNCDTDGKMEK